MPDHTPSPHRFLASNPPSAHTSRPKPHSGLRNALAIQTPASAKHAAPRAESQFKQLTPAKRFVIAPPQYVKNAEAIGKSIADSPRGREDTLTQSTPLAKPRRKLERVESIEEPSQPSPHDESANEDVIQSIETEKTLFDEAVEPQDENDENDDNEDVLFQTPQNHKRRRISPTPSNLSNPLPTHRFRLPPPRIPAPSTTTTTPAAHRPHFILPSLPTSPPKPSNPLPEIFSPSRKNGKYTPDGLASTVTAWIIETAASSAGNTTTTTTSNSSISWGREKEDGVKMRVKISSVSRGDGRAVEEVECFTGRVVFVRGDTEPGLYSASRVLHEHRQMRVLLAGQGGARGSGGVRIRVGSIVGVRAPTWDVDVGGEKWLVGVDWVVL